MYLKEVYRHSKWMFAGMLFFAIAQLFINYKRGMVFSPFFHYGMYSHPQTPRPFYTIRRVFANGDTLHGNDFSPEGWDKIHFTLKQVEASYCDSSFYQSQVSRLFSKLGFSPPPKRYFINEGNDLVKTETYKHWLARQLGKPGIAVEIETGIYRYQSARFVWLRMADTLNSQSKECK